MPVVDNKIYDHIPNAWWSDESFMAMLRYSVNPARTEYFRTVLAERNLVPSQLQVLDVGCGGGLLSEQFAAMGCHVTGIDPSLPTLQAAQQHAKEAGLSINYQSGSGEALPFQNAQFDVVSCCDVLEHVDDVNVVMAEIARVLKPGGLFLFDTINRTLRSKLVTIKVAQDWGLTSFMPRDVHVWQQYIRPSELSHNMATHGLAQADFCGLTPVNNPVLLLIALIRRKLGQINFAQLGQQLRLAQSRDLSIAYMGHATRVQVA